ncbi:MAG: pantetheine-phosphate adenylyltransferase [Oscillospiraceae bacterium]|nr:pantetheine-phosphate adenylyltransferase [Oscillospiraceae bacterium]
MKTAVFPGSFDPVTLGHADVIERAARLFDHVYVAIVPNGAKLKPMFTDEEKLALMRASVSHLPNVEAELWGGLLTDYAARVGAQFLVRAARNATDFDAEYQLSRIYGDVSGGALETVLFCADARYQHISSTMVREMVRYGQDLARYMPRAAAELVKGRK